MNNFYHFFSGATMKISEGMVNKAVLVLVVMMLAVYSPCLGDLSILSTSITPVITSNGYPSLLLGSQVNLNINITFTSNISYNCLLLIDVDENFLFLHETSQNNLTIIHEGITPEQTIIVTNGSNLKIDFGDVLSEDILNTIFITVPITLNKPASFGDLLNITTSVSTQLLGVYEELRSQETIHFLGPEVNSNFNWNNENIIINSYIQAVISLKIAANSELKDIQVTQDFSSNDLSSLPVTYIQCLGLPITGNITFSNSSNANITQFDSTMVSSSHQLIRAKRQVSTSSLSSNVLSWNIGDISNDGNTEAVLELQISFTFGDVPDATATDSILHSLSLNLNGGTISLTSSNLVVSIPQLNITKTIQIVGEEDIDGDKIDVLRFTIEVSHDAVSSNSEAFEVYVEDYVEGFVVEYFDELVPVISTPGLAITKSKISYTLSSLNFGDSKTLSYKAYFNDDTLQNTEQELHLPATLQWQTLSQPTPSFPGTNYGPVEDSVCVKMSVSYDNSSNVTKHGLAALGFFVCVLIAIIIVLIVAVVCIRCFHRGPYSLVQPIGAGKRRGLLINDNNMSGNSVTASYEQSSLVQVDDSIVLILMLKQSSQKYSEFDNLDILTTIVLDIGFEEKRLEAMTMSVELLIQQWTEKKLIPSDISNKIIKKFHRSLKDLTKELNDKFRRDSQMLRKQLIAMNNIKLNELQKKHVMEYKETEEETKFMNEEDKKSEILNLLQQQHEAETANLASILKFQQDEQQEILRKEYAIKKRIRIKSIQQEHLDQVILQGKLEEDQARELISDHWHNMAVLEKRMDEDISKQRMLLEEKLERHRALADRNISQEEHHKEILNTMVKQTIGGLEQLQEADQLTEGQFNQYVEKLQKEVVVAKQKYEQDKTKQEEQLHKRLTALKKQKLTDKAREHTSQLDQFEDEQKKKETESKLEPSEFLDARMQILTKQQLELNDIENEIDEEAAKQLEELREKLTVNMEESVEKTKRSLYSSLKSNDSVNEMKDEILEEHQRNIERLKEEKEEEKHRQEEELKKRLAEKRKNWNKKKEKEKDEQMQIREHESKMVGRLLATQLVMSEIDRDKIMQEHEKQMVTLENNLTLNKLHQRRKLEEKIAIRRARKMEKLEKQQYQEERRQMRSKQLNSDDDEDDDDADEKQKMMKKHVEQKLALLNSEKYKVDEDLDIIRVEMLTERANALKKQEEKLGSMIAQLQLEKAREMATIEEQQKVLIQLKMNMLDDMTDRGVIQSSQSKKVIENHRKEVERLETKLNDAREKQEKEFKKKLKEKQVEREKTFLREQELEMSRLAEKETNSTKARFKRVALKHKQTVQLEEFRQTIEMEKRQSLENLKRDFEMKKMKAVQDQELQLIGNLIRHGKYADMELVNILNLLFPMKTEKELRQLISDMQISSDAGGVQPDSEDQSDDEPKQGEKKGKEKKRKKESNNKMTLEKKIRSMILLKPLSSDQESNEPSQRIKSKKKLAPIKSKKYGGKGVHNSPLPGIPGVRPDPIGRADSIDYSSDQNNDRQYEDIVKKKKRNGKY
ncbi:uncharacterized protein [Antedon mediterranea]|uniref:uncharacterized protein n=1 Tax=Antedon mediterranea TaxID=105859 RepID=UPI003AF57639